MLEGLGEVRLPLRGALDHKEQNRNDVIVITFNAYMMEFLFAEGLGRGLRPTAQGHSCHIGYHSNSGLPIQQQQNGVFLLFTN